VRRLAPTHLRAENFSIVQAAPEIDGDKTADATGVVVAIESVSTMAADITDGRAQRGNLRLQSRKGDVDPASCSEGRGSYPGRSPLAPERVTVA